MSVADEILLYVLLQQQPNAYRGLVRHFGSATLALKAQSSEWRSVGVSPRLCETRAAWPHRADSETVRRQWQNSLAWLDAGQRGLWLDSPEHDGEVKAWPRAFAAVPQRPPLLFWEGDETVLGLPQVALVGSRAATRSGLAIAHNIAADIASAGLVVTSGLASGIDGAAHVGALSVSGKTLAVMGCGLDRVYPPRHQALAAQIRESGLLVSEFVPGSLPEPWCFPRRNAVIAMLSVGVVVVEAGPVSGSIITAQEANQLSRRVWAVPGPITSLQSRGCHRLIRDEQARLVESAQDVLEDALPVLRQWYGAAPETDRGKQVGELPKPPMPSATSQAVLDGMDWQVHTVDSLLMGAEQGAETVLMALGELEMLGWIAAVPGGYQRLTS